MENIINTGTGPNQLGIKINADRLSTSLTSKSWTSAWHGHYSEKLVLNNPSMN